LTIRTLCNGTHTMRDLKDESTVQDVATELHTRLLLPPWRAVCLFHWGRELDPRKTLGEEGLRTDSSLNATLRFQDPGPEVPLTRVRIVSPHVTTRLVHVGAAMLVKDLKEEIEAFHKRGAYSWYGVPGQADGVAKHVEGATLICKVTKGLDVKNLTSSMTRGEHFVLLGLGGDKKDKWRCARADSGHPAQLGFDDAVKLDLPPKAQTLTYHGVVLQDDHPLSAYKVMHNDAITLSFDNPALRAVDDPRAKKGGSGGGKAKPAGAAQK